MNYTYEDYANWYKYYYGNYYAAPPQATPTLPVPPVPPLPGYSGYNAVPAPIHPAPPVPQQKPGGVIKGTIGYGKRAGLGAPQGNPKKVKKAVASVTCPICDITVSSEQVYVTHVNGKAHRKKAEKLGQKDAAVPLQQQQVVATTPKKLNKKKPKTTFGTPQTEQIVYQCDLCSVTVNSQQQLDLHLTGTKHKKTLNRLSKSNDPEIQKKIEASQQQAASIKEQLLQQPASETATTGTTATETAAADAADEEPSLNLPPGYVFIPASQSENGKDTYLCSTCRHYSCDTFSLNAHVGSSEHIAKSAEQEKPLQVATSQITNRNNQPTNQASFNLKKTQTSNSKSWNSGKVKKFVPLAASFVSGEVMK